MGTKIGSLFWEITSDASKFQQGLADTKNKVGQFKSGLNDAVTDLTGFNLNTLAGAGAVVALGKAVIDSINNTQAYNLSMIDLARQMNVTTEEASRLVQVSDDVRISQEAVATAMKFLAKSGTEPSIEALAKMGDEYIALGSSSARTQYLIEKFGRSGVEMGKLLEKGSEGIKKMSSEISDGLIVTEESAAAAEKYFQATDKLNDSAQAFSIAFGNFAIPALTEFLDLMGRGITIAPELGNLLGIMADAIAEKLGIGMDPAKKGMQSLRGEMASAKLAAKELKTEAETPIDPIALDGLTTAAGSASVVMKELTTDLIFQQAAAGLDAEATLTLAQQMGLVNDKTVTAMTELDKLRKLYDDGAISALSYAAGVAAIKDAVDSLKSKTITVKVNYSAGAVTVNGMNVATLGDIPAPSQAGSGSSGGGMQALGGEYNVNKPTMFLAGEAGPETVSFTPASSPKAESAGTGKKQFSFYGPIYFSSPAGMESELMAIGVV